MPIKKWNYLCVLFFGRLPGIRMSLSLSLSIPIIWNVLENELIWKFLTQIIKATFQEKNWYFLFRSKKN